MFEVSKTRSVGKRKVVLIMLILAFLIYLATRIMLNNGFSTSDSFYTVYTTDEQIKNVLSEDNRFLLTNNPESDLYVEVTDKITVYSNNLDRSKAGMYYFELLLKAHNKRIATSYPEELGFPLRIELKYLDRNNSLFADYVSSMSSINTTTQKNSEVIDENYVDKISNTKKSVLSDEDTQVNDNLQKNKDSNIDDLEEQINSETQFNQISSIDSSLPENLNPFSQLKILFLVILMTVPVSMISVIYANSIMSERINKRGVFYLVSPVKSFEVIIGKTLPYFLSAYISALFIILSQKLSLSAIIGSSAVILSVIFVYLAIGFFCAMIARSHRELSFLGIFLISIYTCYLLVPSFMVNISFLSLASPLSLIVKIFQNEIIPLKLYLFSMLPYLACGFAVFIFSLKLFNDEDMFSYRNISEKIIDALKYLLHKFWFVGVITFFSVPFVFLIELMMIVFLISLKSYFSIYILMFCAAFIEECFRNIGIYTIMAKRLHKTKIQHLALYSLISGFGFFLGEKAILLIMIAPFIEAYFTLILAGVIMPLLLHSILTFIFSLLNKQFGKKAFFLSTFITTVLHFSFNLTLSFFIGK